MNEGRFSFLCGNLIAGLAPPFGNRRSILAILLAVSLVAPASAMAQAAGDPSCWRRRSRWARLAAASITWASM